MWFNWLAKRMWLMAAVAALAMGCGGGDDEVIDAPPGGADALPSDGGVDGMPGPCPGQIAYQAGILDWVTGQGIFEATATEVGNETNTAEAAPNGRASLCLPPATIIDVHFEADGYIARTHRVDTLTAELLAAAEIAEPARLLTPEDANDVYVNVTTEAFDPNLVHALVDVRVFPGGEPLTGAQVGVADVSPDAAYALAADGTFAAGDQVTTGGVVFFPNINPGGDEAAITVTTPPGFSGTCATGTVPLITGELSYTLIACQN